MILIGSKAAEAHSALPRWRGGKTSDTDYIGTRAELKILLDTLDKMDLLEYYNESKKFPGKYKIKTNTGIIEFDATDNPSNKLFERLDDNVTIKMFGLWVTVPSMKTLYLVKRSHMNYPVNWHKNYKDLISLGNSIELRAKNSWHDIFSEDHIALYNALRTEADERYNHLQDKIKLAGKEDKFFERSKDHRQYIHDDVHRAIAFHDAPMYERFKKDKDSALLSKELFEQSSMWDKVCLFQEEAMVIGIERFYLPAKTMPANKVYRAGAAKLLHTMCKGFFQDFGLDHIHMLQEPKWDFLHEFEEALNKGEIREQ